MFERLEIISIHRSFTRSQAKLWFILSITESIPSVKLKWEHKSTSWDIKFDISQNLTYPEVVQRFWRLQSNSQKSMQKVTWPEIYLTHSFQESKKWFDSTKFYGISWRVKKLCYYVHIPWRIIKRAFLLHWQRMLLKHYFC